MVPAVNEILGDSVLATCVSFCMLYLLVLANDIGLNPAQMDMGCLS